MHSEHHAASFARISKELLAQPEEQRTLQQIVDLAVQTVPGCQFAGVSVRRGRGRVETPASTSELVLAADQLQYDLDEGPCLDSLRLADTYVIHDAATDGRWPNWAPRVAELGLRSILSVRLSTADTLGGINLYAGPSHAFTEDDVHLAHVYAQHAAGALAAAQIVTGLQSAMRSRHSIGVAQGILMQRYGLTLDRAFEVLVRHSRHHNIKLRDVARDVIEHGGVLPEDPTP